MIQAFETREKFYECLPKNGIGAELGVDVGDNAETILKVAKPARLDLVDAWDDPEKLRFVKNRFLTDMTDWNVQNVIKIHHKYVEQYADETPDGTLNWFYLDTFHNYKAALAQLECMKKKVMVGGVIAGHDMVVAPYPFQCWGSGMVRAILEFRDQNQKQLEWLAMSDCWYADWALKVVAEWE